MKFGLLVQGSPIHSTSCHSALQFARSAVRRGHEVVRVFFYKDAVLLANEHLDVVNREFNLKQGWQEFAESNAIPLTACISAAQRRGIVDEPEARVLAGGFEIGGLGVLIELIEESERLVTFP